MIIERLTPASPVDAALKEAILKGDEASLAPLRASFPAPVMAVLDARMAGRPDLGDLTALAQTLDGAGLPAAAAAALGLAADLFWISSPVEAAAALRSLAELERRLGLTWSAAADQRAAVRVLGQPRPDEDAPLAEAETHAIIDAWNDPTGYRNLLDLTADSPLRDDPLRDPKGAKADFLDSDSAWDFSFFVIDQAGAPVLQVECDVLGRRGLGCRETAIVLARLDADQPPSEEAEVLALRQIEAVSRWAGCQDFIIEVSDRRPHSPAVAHYLSSHSRAVRPLFEAWIDLGQDEAAIAAGFRSGHKQSIRWGEANLALSRFDQASDALTDSYMALHAAAGRVPPMNRQGFARAMSEGKLRVYLARHGDKDVGLAVISLHGSQAYYAAGASAPDSAKPSAHALIHRAILDAKAAGFKRFAFGDIHKGPSWSDKQRSIGQFKHGFTKSVAPKMWFVVPTGPLA